MILPRTPFGCAALVAAAALVPLASPPPARATEATAWSTGAHSAARLIDGGAASDAPSGPLLAGLELRLDPAFITYWRDPGDAGVPPTFDFAGSGNLRSAEVRYPAPKRLDEAGAVAFGYTGDVTLPIEVRPVDPARPVDLRVDLAYAVCHDICLPARARLAIRLDREPSVEASRVLEGLASVPRAAALGQAVDGLAVLGIATSPTGLSVETEAPTGATLFVEGAGTAAYVVGAPAAADGGHLVFPVKQVEAAADGAAPSLILTLVGPGDPPRAIEVRPRLDAAAKTP